MSTHYVNIYLSDGTPASMNEKTRSGMFQHKVTSVNSGNFENGLGATNVLQLTRL